jgi:hypothetical protein
MPRPDLLGEFLLEVTYRASYQVGQSIYSYTNKVCQLFNMLNILAFSGRMMNIPY